MNEQEFSDSFEILTHKQRCLFEILKDPDNRVALHTYYLRNSERWCTSLYEKRKMTVLSYYDTIAEAIAGHTKFKKEYGFV